MKHEFENDKCNWFPRADTVDNARYDKRMPGLFKVEWEEDGLYVARCIIVLGVGKINLVVKVKIREIT